MSDRPARAGLPFLSVVAVTLATATVSFDSGIPNVALPTIARELGVAGSSAVSIVSIYQLVLVVTLLPFAALSERIGHRRTLRIGILLFIAGGVLCTFARSLPMLIAMRICQSLGAAAILSVGAALIRSLYPPQYLGRGLALNTLITTASMALAPTLGGLLLPVLPWYWLFVIGVPTALIALLMSPLIPESAHRDTPFDIVGAVFCMVSFGLVFAGIESAVHNAKLPIITVLLGIGVPTMILFVRRELRVTVPILPLDLLRRPVIALSVSGALLNFLASMSMLVILPFRLHEQFGFSTSATGAILGIWALALMLCAPTAGMLSDRIASTTLGAAGTAVAAIGAVLLALLPEKPSELDVSWRLAVCAAGYAFYASPTFRMVVNAAPRERAASAGSLMTTARMSGQTLGATASGAMLALGIGHSAAPPLITAALFMAVVVLSLVAGRYRTQD
jgi:DHA2 family multidrug resistance protein-like MFS transporter